MNNKKEPQQRPEDAERHNEQQEREYRKQKEGKMGKSPKAPTKEDAIEKFDEIKSEEE